MRKHQGAALALVWAVAVVVLLAPTEAACAEPPAPEDSESRVEIGLAGRFLPAGWFNLTDSWNRSFRAYPAVGASVFADYAINRFVKIGLAPSLTGNVIPNRSDYLVGTMVAGELRLVLQAPIWRLFTPFLVLKGGYSAIFRGSGMETAEGPLLGASAGLRLHLGIHAISAEAGYEQGFQSLKIGAYAPSYVVVSLGWQMSVW